LGEPRAPAATTSRIDGDALARACAGGTEALRRQTDAINAINVFPVPDGDTGTNMYMTMRAALDSVEQAARGSVAAVAGAAAHGALMGARGNSGVILSQILAGIADGAGETMDGRDLAAAFDRARDAAYRVVSAPKEGTILTAITAAAAAADATADAAAEDVLAAATDAAEDAVARTPDLLPVLKEAGVVDAGAQGLFVLLEGMLRGLRGEGAVAHEGGFGAIDASWLSATRRVHEHGDGASGFCTEFVISGARLDADAIRAALRDAGESLLVVGGGNTARVHLHTQDPQRALAYGRSLGTLVHEKVDDMEEQFRRLAAAAPEHPAAALAVVAVGAGDGIERLLASLGARVVRGGQTMNPSAGDIRRAVEACAPAAVIVLPNNKNIVLAARQAIAGLPVRAQVLETNSVVQGIAALVAYNAEAPFEHNVEEMAAASANVRHAEITYAARPTTLHGTKIAAGQPIGIVDGDLAVVADSIDDAVRASVERMIGGRDAPLVSLYAGEGEDGPRAEAIASRLREEFGAEVEVIPGGQPHYAYFVGVE
jgi:DAK2 domain fusion protein YloV